MQAGCWFYQVVNGLGVHQTVGINPSSQTYQFN